MSYLDRSFCRSPHCVNACGRKMDDAQRRHISSLEIWEQVVSWAYFCGEPVDDCTKDSLQLPIDATVAQTVRASGS